MGLFFNVKRFLFLFLWIYCIVSCDIYHVPEGEHNTLSFENSSKDTIYVNHLIWTWGGDEPDPREDFLFHLPIEKCEVAPGKVNHDTCIIPFSYESAFTRTKHCIVYVVPFYADADNRPTKPLYDYKLVSYDLTIEDLNDLDFHLVYPPDERMKNIKMEPPYSYFHSEDK